MLNKPSFIGMCSLELSKMLMCKFHYDYIKIKYGNNSRLIFTDTVVSQTVQEIKTEDVYKGFSNDKEMFDFSHYSIKSKYYDNSNKLMVSKMKDKTTSVAIEEFVD